MPTRSLAPIILIGSVLVACPAPPNFGVVETEGSADCDNLDETHCAFPFPSDHFLARDGGATHVQFRDGTLPVNATGRNVDPSYFTEHDGWPTITPVFFGLGADVTLDGAPAWNGIGASIESTPKTAIVDAETLELQPHFAEFDHFAEREGRKVIALRLARKLAYGRRFIVAVRGLTNAQGAPVPAPRGFAALRDRTGSVVVGLDARRERFESEVFARLEQAGFERASLQLAWDFTTATEGSATRALHSIVDQVDTLIGADGPAYTIDSVEETPDDPHLARIVKATAQVPSFLDKSGSITRIRRDSQGIPTHDGFEAVEFTVQVPKRAYLEDAPPLPVLQYGHGFLGGKGEANNRWLREVAERDGYVVVAADLQGMTSADQATWASAIGADASYIPLLAEKPHQGIANTLAIQRLMKGRFARDLDARITNAGKSVVDPTRLFYYGNSQGGTMGNVVIALSRDVSRAILGVPGGAFGFLLTRAGGFNEYVPLIKTAYADPLDLTVLMGLAQLGFEKIEPLHFAYRMETNPFAGRPAHRVLLQSALNDAQVHNEVTDVVARTIGAKLWTPATRAVWGLQETSTDTEGSVYAQYDFETPNDFPANQPVPEAQDTHEDTRRNRTAQRQVHEFLTTGTVRGFCDGACDPD